jgi:hypothetical protein
MFGNCCCFQGAHYLFSQLYCADESAAVAAVLLLQLLLRLLLQRLLLSALQCYCPQAALQCCILLLLQLPLLHFQ